MENMIHVGPKEDVMGFEVEQLGEALVAICTCDASDQVKIQALETFSKVSSVDNTTISHNVFNHRRVSD